MYECSLYSHTKNIIPFLSKLSDLSFTKNTKIINKHFYKHLKSNIIINYDKNTIINKIGPILERNMNFTIYKIKKANVYSGNINLFLKNLDYKLEKIVNKEIIFCEKKELKVEIFKFENDFVVKVKIYCDNLKMGEEKLIKFRDDVEDFLLFVKI